MSLHSSSISSSETAAARRDGLATLAWTLFWLAALDIAINFAFAYPRDPKESNPGALELYFDYGRSMEGRLRRSTRADPSETAPITLAGWYDPLVAVERPAKPGSRQVTIYGMSHAVRLAEALQEVSPHYHVRSVGAPGATANWSYGAFLRDEGNGESEVAVLAIMSSTLPMILSATPMNWNTSFPLPYTADRFSLAGQELQRIKPPYESFAGYVRAMHASVLWEDALAQFARTDPFYDPLLVRESWLDRSALARLIRRARSQWRDHAWRTDVLTAEGYDPHSEPVRVANEIISDFSRNARAKGMLPVIYIIDSRGYGDQLYRALASTLARQGIPYLATHNFVDPMDPTGYLPDSHFTPANDARLARHLAEIIDDHLPDRRSVE